MKKPDIEQFFQNCAHAIIGVDVKAMVRGQISV